MSLALEGDDSAFNQLVTLHYDKVYGQALRMTKSEEDAKDVAQLTWIKVWKKLSTFKGESAFTSWVYRITTFTALDLIRKRNSNRESASEPDYLENAANSDASSIASPEQVRKLEGKELKARIDDAFSKLPEKLRTALQLREIEGLTYEEMAQQLHCKTGTVMSRLFNARKTIQKHLADLVS
ncbi:sigma-70 family RNA polymerase sigma factor [Pelagicoccus sp. SDUM812002]|uniref:sigma-70 family RNA polymerase sigma factor n=1 Tax=Pelagicoccus sp. SDUM812002 TaxID=3041266 RepID=UPI00280D61D1|nr:sigma-70 family RNA polymerase sigma factor [Pelagicoccus sp. SDUM812002]MDQ8185612.1 sigma-70 family RNA polymerase sigma factor [Pelagicoccus sp. SDUM812002]